MRPRQELEKKKVRRKKASPTLSKATTVPKERKYVPHLGSDTDEDDVTHAKSRRVYQSTSKRRKDIEYLNSEYDYESIFINTMQYVFSRRIDSLSISNSVLMESCMSLCNTLRKSFLERGLELNDSALGAQVEQQGTYEQLRPINWSAYSNVFILSHTLLHDIPPGEDTKAPHILSSLGGMLYSLTIFCLSKGMPFGMIKSSPHFSNSKRKEKFISNPDNIRKQKAENFMEKLGIHRERTTSNILLIFQESSNGVIDEKTRGWGWVGRRLWKGTVASGENGWPAVGYGEMGATDRPRMTHHGAKFPVDLWRIVHGEAYAILNTVQNKK
ncbi:hypothetical protein M5K25_013464 [Dendrobium thyrsiflorum]|uniref:Uncharacterized protein n=1 Tax=Dendrobium thyrsiflorum TaxID=117978 RepID=A0ABD0UTG8_DENTH